MELEQVSEKPKLGKSLKNYYIQSTIPWSAIMAGVIISLGLQILLNFLGVALGTVTLLVNTTITQKIIETSWLLISSIIAMCIGGWFVGAFSVINGTIKSACYGAITWCIIALVAVFVTTNVVTTTFTGGLIALNNDPNVTIYRNLQAQHSPPQATPIVLDSQADEHTSNEQTKQYIKDIGKTSFILFCNFLVGLIASAVGAIIGDKYPVSVKLRKKI